MNHTLHNLTIELTPERLNRRLATMHARQLHSFTARLVRIPTDVTSVVLRIFRPVGGFYDIPVSLRPDGSTGIAYAIGPCFPEVGEAKYEVHAYDARGNATALGVGLLAVDPFSATGEPLRPGEERPVMTLQDRSGATHTITAIYEGKGANGEDVWTSVIDDDWAVGKGSAVMRTITDKGGNLHGITETEGTSEIGEHEND